MGKNSNRQTKKMTIREVAQLAGVSTATISRVLNEPDKVSKEVKEKVEKVIEEYNYVPNQLAQKFTTNNSRCIAIFIYDIANPFFVKIIEGINRISFDNDYTLFICDSRNNKEREMKYLNYLLGAQVSGIIVTEGASEDIIKRIGNNIPSVMIDRNIGPKWHFPIITSDNYNGACTAVEHLIQLNHKKIAFAAGPENICTTQIRKKGYIDTMKKYGLPIYPGYIYHDDFNVMGGVRSLEHCMSLSEIPTAIFCANDLLAQGIILRSHSMKLTIPNDISLIGFDGIMPETFYPKITTIQQQVDQIIECTMEALFKMINHEKCEGRITIPTKLIIGNTTQKI
ncbi:LacI family DNA-binding transcriptional regulator [Petroclostridium sp. X23]|uniref:LacI family DNA-binding transcriptional regulator n=1 Tax=Petroclostridium sp. X23 TaxID=3045146 RepID=UPI0024AD2405|nr:LacI family DNA-binding transcriptional regulator [Petroclostridium sp. X23]WHH58066.1 LacI family DNA-binding transcriptional regulator [Petroclostridium sp. X23]